MTVQIFIDYKTIDSPEWITVEFTPEEYFDYDYIETDEKIEWDTIPEYNDAIDYLDIDIDLILNTHLRIIDRDAQVTREVKTTFWNKGNNYLSECTERGEGIDKILHNWRMIINNKIQSHPTIWEIMRFVKKENHITLEFHCFIQDNEDGTQSEIIVDSKSYSSM